MHISVLYYELIDNLNISDDGIYVDCTGGGGGHASLLLERLGKNGRLITLDRDIEAVARLQDKFAEDKRVEVVHSNFADIDTALLSRSIGKVDGIYTDFGVSSFQLQEAERGFSFRKDGPLDMRMDTLGIAPLITSAKSNVVVNGFTARLFTTAEAIWRENLSSPYLKIIVERLLSE